MRVVGALFQRFRDCCSCRRQSYRKTLAISKLGNLSTSPLPLEATKSRRTTPSIYRYTHVDVYTRPYGSGAHGQLKNGAPQTLLDHMPLSVSRHTQTNRWIDLSHVDSPQYNNQAILVGAQCIGKGKGIPYTIRTWGPELTTVSIGCQPAGDVVINPVVGCHYFPPGPRLPSQPESVTAL